ncbi:MAG: primase-like protein [Thermoleophilia bacterium]|nr:primase-like protein [Thermoleophilia bacterium]
MTATIEPLTNVGTKRDREASARALAALAAIDGGGAHEIAIGQTKLKLTNVDKVLWPEAGFTKLDMATYYATIAPALLTHLRGRPLTLKRYPHGVDGEFFYQKRAPKHRPDWVATTPPIGDQQVDYVLPDDVRTIVWAANLADIELHPLLAHADDVLRPTVIAFDLDPGVGAGVVECCEVALLVRDLFTGLGMQSFPKTSGSKGIQVYIPLNDPNVTYDDTKPFAKAVAELLAQQHPHLVVFKQLKTLREGKVLVDWSQNDESKTTVNVYSLRAKARPTISTPLQWEEVEAAFEAGDQEGLRFEQDAVLHRVRTMGDLFEPVAKLHQPMPTLG